MPRWEFGRPFHDAIFEINLYLLGSGNWSNYATGNPTPTVAALALWAADTIQKRLASG